MNINEIIAKELDVKVSQVEKTVELIDQGNTIPFIARYRKEVTGNLSDEQLRDLDSRLTYLRNLEERKQEVIDSITNQEKMTPEIMAALEKAQTQVEVEDIHGDIVARVYASDIYKECLEFALNLIGIKE